MQAARTGSMCMLASAGGSIETNGVRGSRSEKANLEADDGAVPARKDGLAVIARFTQSRQRSPAAAARVRGHRNPHLICSRRLGAGQAVRPTNKSSALPVISEADGGGDFIEHIDQRPSLYAFGDERVAACAENRTPSGDEWDVSLWMDVAEDASPLRAPRRAPVF
mmetsp:Transcript_109062/g.314141  ORF Transcript_109062/g.314141 Transcript_109062/m.314141 type:complete len:166 (+) Transcript_109062:98-595(+)